jgi:polysaccharide export outer membrane protein
MKKIQALSCLLLFASLISCMTKELRVKEYSVAPGTPDPAKPPEEFYVIGPGDALEIVVWKDPTLSGAVKVRPDGFITVPLINEIQATGLTTAQLRKTLEEKYKEFVANPFVTVRVAGISSTEIFLIGQVARPAAYPAVGNDTLLQIITRAGGLTIFADRSNIRVVRREKDKVKEYIVDYDAIIKGDLKQDIILRPGDRVIVP